jgi:hypothetical protein
MEANRAESEIALRAGRDASRLFRLDLPFTRELADVPPAAQRFDQLHAARHLLPRDMTTVSRFTSKIICAVMQSNRSRAVCAGFGWDSAQANMSGETGNWITISRPVGRRFSARIVPRCR